MASCGRPVKALLGAAYVPATKRFARITTASFDGCDVTCTTSGARP
jgi:hypothetical protein